MVHPVCLVVYGEVGTEHGVVVPLAVHHNVAVVLGVVESYRKTRGHVRAPGLVPDPYRYHRSREQYRNHGDDLGPLGRVP